MRLFLTLLSYRTMARAAARAICESTGAAPAGYFVVGDGPTIGPWQ